MDIFPKVRGSIRYTDGSFPLPDAFSAELGGFSPRCLDVFYERCSLARSGEARLFLQRVPGFGREEYTLRVDANGISVSASDEQGVILALTSLWQLCENGAVPCCEIHDAPRYRHRALSFDCARQFFSVAEIKRVLEQMSRAKMNTLHWHLSDDQAWRVEIESYPLLCEKSGAHYTKADIRELVEYAMLRGIEIIPEIDMPGHTTSVMAAYPEFGCFGKQVELPDGGGVFPVILCAGQEKVYQFLDTLFNELCPLFPSPYFHIGGDEAPKNEWNKCPHCQALMREKDYTDPNDLQGLFAVRVAELLKKHGKKPVCWNEILKSSVLPDELRIQYWTPVEEKRMLPFAESGGDFVYSDMFELYLDYPHSMTPLKKLYSLHPHIGRRCCEDLPNMLGIECCIWQERIHSEEELEKHLFPRVFAVAEKAWGSSGSYGDFCGRLEKLVARAESAGVRCTERSWWDPRGKARIAEGTAYFKLINSDVSADAAETSTTASNVDISYALRFIRCFFKPHDIPALLKALKEI